MNGFWIWASSLTSCAPCCWLTAAASLPDMCSTGTPGFSLFTRWARLGPDISGITESVSSSWKSRDEASDRASAQVPASSVE